MRIETVVRMSGFFLVASTSETPLMRAQTRSQKTQVENGLTARVQIVGRPYPHWKLAERMNFYHVPGVQIAVIDHARIAWADSYGVLEAGRAERVNDDTLFQAASVSKVTTALTMLRTIDAGRCSLDADADSLLTAWKFPAPSNPVTVRQLLSHNAAINWPTGEVPQLPSVPVESNVDRCSADRLR
jgi:CubicO group peptidase (beta-lactamase class C family)